MPWTVRSELTRWAVQDFPWPVRHPHPVQRRGDVLVGPARRHAAHHRQRLLGRAAAVLAGFGLADPQLRVLAAPPVDHQDDLARRLVDVGDDVGDQGAHEPLAGAHGRARRVPGGFEVLGEAGEVRRDGGRGRRPHRLQPRLARLDPPQRRLPALLQLCGDQAVVGIAGRVAPLRKRRLVARLLQLQIDDALPFVLGFHVHRSASRAASIAIGSTARSSSPATAASMRGPPNVRHRGRPSIRFGRSQR